MNRMVSTLMATALLSTTVAAQPIYETDFESSGDPSGVDFTLGNLDTQGGWTVEAGGGGANVVNTPLTAASGSNYVAQEANSSIAKSITGSSDQKVLMLGYYHGEGSATLQVPPSANPIAVVLGFRAVNASTLAIAAFDGVDEEFREPATGNTFDNSGWQQIVVSIDYTAKTYDVAVNDQPYLQNVNFHDNTISGLSAFQSFAESPSDVDRLGFFATDGDYDDDGYTDDEEMMMAGANPLDPSLPGQQVTFGDVNDDGDVTPIDAQETFMCYLNAQCGAGIDSGPGDLSPDDGDDCVDGDDGDGSITPQDAQRVFELYLGTVTVCAR